MQTQPTAEEASLRQLLRQKLQDKADLFATEHLQILLDRGFNSEELLPTATWKDLVEDPALPEGLLVQLLQAYNPQNCWDSVSFLCTNNIVTCPPSTL